MNRRGFVGGLVAGVVGLLYPPLRRTAKALGIDWGGAGDVRSDLGFSKPAGDWDVRVYQNHVGGKTGFWLKFRGELVVQHNDLDRIDLYYDVGTQNRLDLLGETMAPEYSMPFIPCGRYTSAKQIIGDGLLALFHRRLSEGILRYPCESLRRFAALTHELARVDSSQPTWPDGLAEDRFGRMILRWPADCPETREEMCDAFKEFHLRHGRAPVRVQISYGMPVIRTTRWWCWETGEPTLPKRLLGAELSLGPVFLLE